jgi:hypothetical protein
MRRYGLALTCFVLAVGQGESAYSLPTYGANCASCHSGARGTIAITGNDTTANPAEACGSPDRGTLKVFQVHQGATRSLTGTLSGLTSGTRYAGVMKGLDGTGVGSCGAFTYTADPSWASQGGYYTTAIGNFSGTPAFNFNLTVGPSTPPDFYDLILATAGVDGSGRFYTESHLYVQVLAASPTIALSKTALTPSATQGMNPVSDTFTVSNTGSATLNYTVSDDATWMTVSPASGSTTGAANTITVQYSTASLAVGSYTGTITVTDPAATNNPQTVHVTLTVNAAPKATIALSKTALTPSATQGMNPVSDTFTVSNTGSATLNYTISDDAAWMTVSPASGSTTGAANTITVQYSAASLTVGGYTGTITVTDPAATNNPQTVKVTLTINATPVPAIVVSKTALTPSAGLGSNAPDDAFTVANGGQGTLNYAITSDAAWLTVAPASGSSTGAAVAHTVQYTTAALAAGSYTATITISDIGGMAAPQTVSVNLTVSAEATSVISVSTNALNIKTMRGLRPAASRFKVSNSGSGTLQYAITTDANWMTIWPLSGSSTGGSNTHYVRYNVNGMAVGTYTATITVSDVASVSAPQTITVTLTVTARTRRGGDDAHNETNGSDSKNDSERDKAADEQTPTVPACGAGAGGMVPALLTLGLSSTLIRRRGGRSKRDS